MRIIHCADIHLDSQMTSYLDSGMARKRRKEIFNTFCSMLDFAQENRVDAIIIAGDLFDTDKISMNTVKAVTDEIQRHGEVTVFYLPGNHDRKDNIFRGCNIPDNMIVLSGEWSYWRLNEVYGVQEIRTGQKMPDETVILAGCVLDEYTDADTYDHLQLPENTVNIVTLHGQIYENGGRNNADSIDIRRLQNRCIDYLALGHVHAYQDGRLDQRGRYCYPGCLEGRGFDECGEHGFVMLDVDALSGVIRSRFVPWAYRRISEIQVDVTGMTDMLEVEDTIAERLYSESRNSDMERIRDTDGLDIVRVILAGDSFTLEDISVEHISERFKDSFFYFSVLDRTYKGDGQTGYENEVSLKGEFVRTVMASQLSQDDKEYIIAMGIRALAGEEIVIE